MSEIEWVQVGVCNTSRKSCVSSRLYYGWRIVALKNMRNTAWDIEIACTCLKNSDYRIDMDVEIPPNRNSVVVICNVCETQMVRFVGFCTGKWEMYLNADLAKEGL